MEPPTLSVTVPDSLVFTRAFETRDILLRVMLSDWTLLLPWSGDYQARWTSTDTSVLAVPATSAGPVTVSSKLASGTATLSVTVTASAQRGGDSATASIHVVVNRTPRGARLVFTRERTLARGAFRAWRGDIVDSSGFAIVPIPLTVRSSNPAVLSVSDTGVIAGEIGEAEVTVDWSGGQLLRDTVRVAQGIDFGEVRSASLNTLCPSGHNLIGAARTLAMLAWPSCNSQSAWSWKIIPLDRPPGGMAHGVAAMSNDGRFLHVSGEPFILRSYTPAGQLGWAVRGPSGVGPAASVAIGSNGVVFVNARDAIVALDSVGLRWTRSIGSALAVIASADGSGAVAVTGDSVLRFDDSGAVQWRFAMPNLSGPVALGTDGRLVVWRRTNSLIAISADGALLWETPVPDPSTIYPNKLVIGPSGDVFLSVGGALVCLGTTGSVRWTTPVNGTVHPVIAADGRIYALQGAEGNVIVIDPGTGTVIGRTLNGLGSAPLGPLDLVLLDGILAGSDGHSVNWLQVPFGPATGWSHPHGDAGRTNSPIRP